MREQGLWPAILGFARNVGIVDACIFALAGLSCLPVAWRTLHHFGNMAMLLGGLAMLVGALSQAGNVRIGRDVFLFQGQSAHRRTKRLFEDRVSGYRFMFVTGIAGGIAALLGDLIRRIVLSV